MIVNLCGVSTPEQTCSPHGAILKHPDPSCVNRRKIQTNRDQIGEGNTAARGAKEPESPSGQYISSNQSGLYRPDSVLDLNLSDLLADSDDDGVPSPQRGSGHGATSSKEAIPHICAEHFTQEQLETVHKLEGMLEKTMPQVRNPTGENQYGRASKKSGVSNSPCQAASGQASCGILAKVSDPRPVDFQVRCKFGANALSAIIPEVRSKPTYTALACHVFEESKRRKLPSSFVPPSEEYRNLPMKERNRLSAIRSRKRRQEEMDRLRDENTELKATEKKLRQENAMLNEKLAKLAPP